MSTDKKLPPSAGQNSLIPEKYLDVPSQRLYYLSLGLLCQAIKIMEFGWTTVVGTDDSLGPCMKWLLVDALYCITLALLRIPRLNYGKAVIFLQISTLWFFDGLMFGGLSLNFGGGDMHSRSYGRSNQEVLGTPEPFSLLDLVAPLTFGLISSTSDKDAHLLGQHTVRMSPISTAQLYPNSQTFCLSSQSNFVLVPVLLNNTHPHHLRYSISPLGHNEQGANGKIEYFDLSAKELKAIEQSRIDALQLARPNPTANHDSDDYDKYDDDDDENDTNGNAHSNLQKSQSITHIKVTKSGTIRLERVVDSSSIDARLMYPSELKIAPCPTAEFVGAGGVDADIKCIGQDPELPLVINIAGVAPLSLKWSKAINGQREPFLVEGIEGEHRWIEGGTSNSGAVQDVQVPLVVTLDRLGNHEYTLEEVVDSIGNVVPLSTNLVNPGKVYRSYNVLRHPSVSFKSCAEGRQVPLLIGSEATLAIATNDADPVDGPWDVVLKYQPSTDADDVDVKSSKKHKPWTKTLQKLDGNRDLTIKAATPGRYTIASIKGKYCTGDVLSPESCNVVEKPYPTAEIEWKRIHECSGDTGVSASLVFHGSPPFTVHYQVQRDAEAARDQLKTFNTARGELTLQPERSGRYIYKFTYLSDSNYKKVGLNGPSIDQIVHPLASAEFVDGSRSAASGRKKVINICEGASVNADVELRGTGPWNLELQIVGPRKSETIVVQNITTPRKTLEIPIPKSVDKDGGAFEVDLVSIEDAYACKRALSGAGILVNVRRIKPTVKFYGKDTERRVVVLESDKANLPLRLSGQGPWKVSYHRIGDEEVIRTMLASPNDHLQVTQKGTYELLAVSDSLCPGWVIDGKTYEVDWVPRPYAKLSPKIEAIYESFNNSHILPPICEGNNAHVDLELTGRPPFQIMYNIAQGNENGGTKLLDQPVFNSIQAQTRFQLHTSRPGRMYYEVKQIGDAAYPLAQHKNAIIPRSERLLFEQQVAIRPSARFKSRSRLSYCLNELFVPTDQANGVVVLEGSPPFTLKLSIRSIGTSHIHTEIVEVNSRVWELNLPSYTFQTVGAHHVTIDSVLDASKCAQAGLDPLSTSIWVDVAETASIVPFERRTDYCVGEVSQFQLEGIPPWSIGYRINGKSYTQEAKTSPFSLLQQQPGEFSITSIAHRKQMCKASVKDMVFSVHPLPSAQVGHGKRIFQDIHEGDQAEIVFTLIGEPPFTFTYQRAEVSSKKGGKAGKVLETHTVSRVNAREYSIFSALEGTWTVTSISDKYCRYPQAQPEIGTDRRRT
ncbi:hypothetical protein PTI98_000954 [Pleurotus ostreatus]|nr:hypothetical protein PTI98_000954 [Pleurotus ostreatus]